ncbi:CvpA family protein [Thermodesulfobacteriota bacterium]
MNLLDYIIIAILVFFTIKGVLKGFIREIASLVGIILGVWLGILYIPQVNQFLSGYVPDSRFLPLISFALIFAGVVILCNIIGWALRLFFKKVFLGWFDKLMGAVFAVLKTILLTYLIIVILTFFVPAKAPLIAESLLAPWVIKSYQSIAGLFSPDHYKNLKKKMIGEKEKVSKFLADEIKKDVKSE